MQADWLTDGSEKNLCCYRLGHISRWIRQLLGHVCNCVRRTDGESSVENTRKEGHTITPTRTILPFFPHKVTTGVRLRHCSNDDDRDKTTSQHQEETSMLKVWNEAIAENTNGTA